MTQTTTTHTNTPRRGHPAVVRAALRSCKADSSAALGWIKCGARIRFTGWRFCFDAYRDIP